MKNIDYENKINKLFNSLSNNLPEFIKARELLAKTRDIYIAKDSDYCEGEIPMQNLRGCEEIGIPAWKGVLIRMGDKKRRIQSFLNKGTYQVEDEKVEDTLLDLCNYAILCDILFMEQMTSNNKSFYAPININAMLYFISYYALLCAAQNQLQKDYVFYWNEIIIKWNELTVFIRNSPSTE